MTKKQPIAQGEYWTVYDDGSIRSSSGDAFFPLCTISEFLSLWKTAKIGSWYDFNWGKHTYYIAEQPGGPVKFLGFPLYNCKECGSENIINNICNNCGEWQND